MCASEPPDNLEASSAPPPGQAPDVPPDERVAEQMAALAQATAFTRRRAVINSAANYGQYAVSLLAMLFLQAYVIRKLGKDGYALWPLVTACMSLFMVVPSALHISASRFLAHALGGKRLEEVERITTSVFACLLVAAALLAAGVCLVSVYFEAIFDIPAGNFGIGPWAMLLGGLAAAVGVPFSIFRGGLQATQNFVALNVIELVLVLVRVGLVVLAFALGTPSLIWVGGAYLAAQVVSSIVTVWVNRKRVPWQGLRRGAFDWGVLAKLARFSFWILIASIGGRLYWETDSLIINKLIDPVLLTGYAVVVAFVVQCQGLALLGSSVLSPPAAVMHARGDLAGIANMIHRANRVIVPTSVPFLIFLAVFGEEVLTAYLGEGYQEYAVLFRVLAAPIAVSLTQTSSGAVPQACGRVAVPSVVGVLVALANLGMSLFFVIVLDWGLIGVALGTAIVALVFPSVFWPWYVAGLLGVRWWKHFFNTLVGPLVHCIPVGVFLMVMRQLGLGRGLAQILAVFFAAAALHAIYMLAAGMAPEDRLAARAALGRAASRLLHAVRRRGSDRTRRHE